MATKKRKWDLEINDHNRGYYLIAVVIIAIGMAMAFITATPEQREEYMNLGGVANMLPDQIKIFGTN